MASPEVCQTGRAALRTTQDPVQGTDTILDIQTVRRLVRRPDQQATVASAISELRKRPRTGALFEHKVPTLSCLGCLPRLPGLRDVRKDNAVAARRAVGVASYHASPWTMEAATATMECVLVCNRLDTWQEPQGVAIV